MSLEPRLSALTPSAALLGPVIGLNAWHFAMELWMYTTRVRWVTSPNVNFSNTWTKAQFEAKQPPEVRWIADNYNHLFEQPTQFYAVALTLALLGDDGIVGSRLAWMYVGGRVVHSLVQCLGNKVTVRLGLFWVNSGILAALTARAGLMLAGRL